MLNPRIALVLKEISFFFGGLFLCLLIPYFLPLNVDGKNTLLSESGIFLVLLTFLIFYGYLKTLKRDIQIQLDLKNVREKQDVLLHFLHQEKEKKAPAPPSQNAFSSRDPCDSDPVLSETQTIHQLVEEIVQYDKILEQKGQMTTSASNGLHPLEQETFLTQLKQAVESGRIEMLMQPIVSLPQRKPRFFESFSRIRMRDDWIIGPDDYLSMAKDHSLIQTIDHLILFRCIQLIRKTLRKNFNVCFFVNLSSVTLTSDFFRENFIEFIRDNAPMAPNLIFEIDYGTAQENWPTLKPFFQELQSYGCRFSVDQVPVLNLDQDMLSQLNIKFVKMDAEILQQSLLNDPEGKQIQALKKMLDCFHCDLIITKIEQEQVLVNLLEFQVDFGQGYLFGPPKLVQ